MTSSLSVVRIDAHVGKLSSLRDPCGTYHLPGNMLLRHTIAIAAVCALLGRACRAGATLSHLCAVACLPQSSQQLTAAERTALAGAAICFDGENANPWPAIATAIGGKRIVLLGEFSHGTREIQEQRNELIRYLHDELDFGVLLLETGIGEVLYARLARDQQPAERLHQVLLRQWRTASWLSTMKLVKELRLDLAGFDVQRSNGAFGQVLREWGQSVILDPEPYLALEKSLGRISHSLGGALSPVAREEAKQVLAAYDELAKKSQRVPGPISPWVRRTLVNRIRFLGYQIDFGVNGDYAKRFNARDAAMADNVRWLLREVFAKRRVIIIGHNFHTSRSNRKLEVMGEILAKEHGDEMFSIGTFGAAGSHADNRGRVRSLAGPADDVLDMKHIIEALGPGRHFLPMTAATRGVLSRLVTVSDSFVDLSGRNRLVPTRHFDALLLFDKVSPAVVQVR